MKDGLTWYRVYRKLCADLGIIFPYKQSEISPRINPIPNNLEFHKKKASKKDVNDNLNIVSKVYFKIYKDLGSIKFTELCESNDTFLIRCMEYPDRRVNLSTIISVLYLSGYKGDKLYEKSIGYLKGDKND